MSELVCRTLELLAESKDAFASAVKNIFDTKTMTTLKIRDLSVGDWVQNNYGNYVKVVGMWQGCNFNYQVDILRDGKIGTIAPCNIHPIPITAEILEKNGWRVIEKEVLGDEYEYDGEKRVWDDYSIDICETKPGVFWYSWRSEYFMWRLEYVHQLQHLIRLAGLDKEINL